MRTFPVSLRLVKVSAPAGAEDKEVAVVAFDPSDRRAGDESFKRNLVGYNYTPAVILEPLEQQDAVPRYRITWYTGEEIEEEPIKPGDPRKSRRVPRLTPCSQGTLAAAWVALKELNAGAPHVVFEDSNRNVLTAVLKTNSLGSEYIVFSLPIPVAKVDASAQDTVAAPIYAATSLTEDDIVNVATYEEPGQQLGNVIVQLKKGVDMKSLKILPKKLVSELEDWAGGEH